MNKSKQRSSKPTAHADNSIHPAKIELLLQLIDEAFHKTSWHGPTLLGSLRRVSPEDAARTIHGRKSVWEQALHSAYWKQRVINRVLGAKNKLPRKGSNWLPVPSTIDEATWQADLQLLEAVHATLRGAVEQLTPAQLTPKLEKMIRGIALHDVYHAGQVKLLRRFLEDSKP